MLSFASFSTMSTLAYCKSLWYIIFVIYYFCNILSLQYIIFAIYDYAALQALHVLFALKASTACPTALHVLFPFQSPTQCYVHTYMMTQLVTWWRLYEYTLLWWPVSHRVESRFYIVQFNIDFTLQVKLILPLVNPETNSLWDNVPFSQSAESLLPLYK